MEPILRNMMRSVLYLLFAGTVLFLFTGCGPQRPASIDSAIENRQEYNAGFAVWQGFRFQWTYNHRMNRFGNYVTFDTAGVDSYRVNSVQTAATGIGDDRARYIQNMAFVRLTGAEVIKKRLEFTLENRKGLPLETVETVKFDLKDRNYRDPKIVTLLNGFDLISQNSAQKLQTLAIEVSDATYDIRTETGSYNVTASLNMDCRSIECNKLDRRYKYTLTVEVMLVAVPDFLHETRDTVSASFGWTRKQEPKREVVQSVIDGAGNNRYQQAFLGIKRLETSLEREHWYLDWDSAARLEEYDPVTGRGRVRYHLFFRNWADGMRQDSPERLESKFSFRESGRGEVGMVTSLIQFSRGCAKPVAVRDSIRWSGKRTQPNSPEAVRNSTLTFHRNCSRSE